MEKQISIVIPVYNEEEIVNQVIEDLKKELIKIPDLRYEIIAINDASTDKTKDALGHLMGIQLINHEQNKGYGASLKTGIKNAKFEWILIIDADGTYPTNSVAELLNYVPEYDMIVGARKKYRPILGKPAKWFLNKFASYLTNTKVLDLNSGMRIFKREIALNFWNLFPEKFSFSSTLTMVCLTNGYSLKNVKIDYLKRNGKSKLKPFKSFKEFIKLIFKLALHFNPLKVFMPIGITLFLGGVALLVYDLFFADKILDTTISIFIMTSIQIVAIGMMAELIIKNYKNKK